MFPPASLASASFLLSSASASVFCGPNHAEGCATENCLLSPERSSAPAEYVASTRSFRFDFSNFSPKHSVGPEKISVSNANFVENSDPPQELCRYPALRKPRTGRSRHIDDRETHQGRHHPPPQPLRGL